MKLLVDNCLSPDLALQMSAMGHEAFHVRDFDAGAASDSEVLQLAARLGCVLVFADTDFGALLAHLRSTKPSFVLIRTTSHRRVSEIAALLSHILAVAATELTAGAVVTIRDDAFRVRILPLW